MKKLYFFLLALLFSAASAQNISITDVNFKSVLLSADVTNNIAQNALNQNFKIDANGDGEIQLSEAAAVKKLKLISNGTPEMSGIVQLQGIENFNSLDSLKVRYLPQLQTINANGMANLKGVVIYGCYQLVNTNFQGCTGLVRAEISGNNALTALSFQNLPLLNHVDASQNNLQTLAVNGCAALTALEAMGNHLVALNLSGLSNLETARLNSNNLTTLTLLNNTALNSLEVRQNSLQSLALLQAPLLTYLSIEYNQFSTINLANSTLLTDFYCEHNQFVTLDFSALSNLEYFDCSNNSNLKYIFMKNGKNNLANGNQSAFSYNPALLYICADDDELSTIGMYLGYYNQNNVAYSSYCTFTPGGTSYTLQGETRYDMNNNGCDPADPKKALLKFNISGINGTGNVIGNTTGQYTIPLQAGSHTISPVLENPSYFNISPASFTANFPSQTSPLTQNFCMTANGNHNDLEIIIIPLNAARPGFLAEYKVLFKNKGTTTQSGNFSFYYDDNLMNFQSSSLAVSSQSFGVLNYQFSNVFPFQTREMTVKFILNSPVQLPALNGGAVLTYTAQMNGGPDETPLDNNFILHQTVANSMDPNDKICLEGTSIAQTKVGDYVHYLIRFENTGTANAQHVVVKDLIDTAKFDLNSLVALGGSHSFISRITEPGTVEFIFENIQLPFTDPYNGGFVSFKIKTNAALSFGDTFSNAAAIYFDYNAPIITNTYTTTVSQTLGTQENAVERSLIFYPNPVNDVIHFNTDEKLLKLEIYDVAGRIAGSVPIQNKEANLSFLKTGNYLLKVYTKDSFSVHKMMKK